jgi:adenosylhomocysteine nucleosidase
MIAIISMAQEETGQLRSEAVIESVESYAGLDFYIGTLDSVEIVLACSGIGEVSAAEAARFAIDRFGADTIITTAPAGPLVPYLQQGDIVVADQLREYNTEYLRTDGQNSEILIEGEYECDSGLLARIADAYEGVFGKKSNRLQLIQGAVISSDCVISDRKTIGRLQREFGAVAVDREGAATARLCREKDVPFLVIRTIVDCPDGDFHNRFDTQLQVIPEYITAIVRHVISVPREEPVI